MKTQGQRVCRESRQFWKHPALVEGEGRLECQTGSGTSSHLARAKSCQTARAQDGAVIRLFPARVDLNYLAWQWAEEHSFSCLRQPVPLACWQPWHGGTPHEPAPEACT